MAENNEKVSWNFPTRFNRDEQTNFPLNLWFPLIIFVPFEPKPPCPVQPAVINIVSENYGFFFATGHFIKLHPTRCIPLKWIFRREIMWGKKRGKFNSPPVRSKLIKRYDKDRRRRTHVHIHTYTRTTENAHRENIYYVSCSAAN